MTPRAIIIGFTAAGLLASGASSQNAPMQLAPARPAPNAQSQQPSAVPLPPPRPTAPQQAAPQPAAPQPPAARGPAPATQGAGRLNATQVATLQRINEVYNSVREMSGRFTQIENDGARSTGRFYITKPGRIRFLYDRPNPLDIVADGTDLVVRDRRLNTSDLYPLSQTPLRYLTNERIDLMRDARVMSVLAEQDMIGVTIEARSTFSEGQLTLYFDAANYSLRQWTITDARGAETAVSVSDLTTNQRNNPQLFAIDRTQVQTPRGN